MEIKTERYFSTYGFVSQNKLEDQADKLFGKGWEAEDDVEQIQKLCDSVKANAYVVSSINGLKYDDDIEVKEVDPVYEWFQNFVDFVQEYDDSVYNYACKWADKKEKEE